MKQITQIFLEVESPTLKRTHILVDYTSKKMKYSIKDFVSKCDQIRRFLRIWSHLLKKSIMAYFIFCAVLGAHFPPYDPVRALIDLICFL